MIHLFLKNAPPSVKPPVLGAHWLDRTSKRRWTSVGTALLTDWREDVAGTGTGGSIVFPPYDTRLLLKAAPATDFAQMSIYTILGEAARWDGGMAMYVYDQNSTAGADENSVMQPDNVPGRLHKLLG